MTSHTRENPFTVLGIAPDASDEEIRKAYFEAVRRYPPDRDQENFRRIRSAYEKIQNADQRIEWKLGFRSRSTEDPLEILESSGSGRAPVGPKPWLALIAEGMTK